MPPRRPPAPGAASRAQPADSRRLRRRSGSSSSSTCCSPELRHRNNSGSSSSRSPRRDRRARHGPRRRDAGIDLSVGAVMALSAATLPAYLDPARRSPSRSRCSSACSPERSTACSSESSASSRSWPRSGCSSRGEGSPCSSPTAGSRRSSTRRSAPFGTKQLVGGLQPGVLIALALTAIIAFLVGRTSFGRGCWPSAATGRRPTGGPAGQADPILVYCSAGLLPHRRGPATARSGASDPSFVGLLIELSAITAVVVGGTPLAGGRVRVLGTVAGRDADAAHLRHPDPPRSFRLPTHGWFRR